MTSPKVMSFGEWMRENQDLVTQMREDASKCCPKCGGDGQVSCFHCGVGMEDCDDCDGEGKFRSADDVPLHVIEPDLRSQYQDQVKLDMAKWDAWHSAVTA